MVREIFMSAKTRYLVTGGAGFIGSHLVDFLVERGFEVRVIDNFSSGSPGNILEHLKSGKAELIEGDIRNAEIVKRSLDSVNVVAHLAAVTSVPFSVANPTLTYDVNVNGTLTLLRCCVEAKVDKLVFASSCAVYGDPKKLPVNEKALPNPISPYAESKLEGERHCRNICLQEVLKAVVLRFFNVYGSRQGVNDYSGVITKFIDHSKRGLPLIVYGDGSQSRDFVSVYDVVKAVVASAENDSANGEVLNIGSGKAVTINNLAKTIADLSGRKPEIRHEAARIGDIKGSRADISKAKRLLGYVPVVALEDGLRSLMGVGVSSDKGAGKSRR
jgi:UDP-glucose 4-epimerase